MGFVVPRLPVPGTARRWSSLDHRIRPPGPSQTHPTGRPGKPHFEVFLREALHDARSYGFRAVRGASGRFGNGRPRIGSHARPILIARTGRHPDRVAATGAAGAIQFAGARAFSLLLGPGAAPFPKSWHGSSARRGPQEHHSRRYFPHRDATYGLLAGARTRAVKTHSIENTPAQARRQT